MEDKPSQTTEQAILEVAERIFLEKGFAQTSTTEIAKAVGCNQALVHYYFRTKDNLFNTIFEQKFKMFFQSVFEMKDLEEYSFLDKMKYIIESHFDMVMANSKLPLLIINEFSRRPEQLRILRDKLQNIPEKAFEKLNSELEVEIAAGRIRQISLMDLVMSTVSLNISLFLLMPIASELMSLNETQKQFVIIRRRTENVNLIMNSLRP
ncbi:MAG: TetR/AcrR family transcriptional regulator [Paludibacter sp.]